MQVSQKKSETFLIRLTPTLKQKIDAKSEELHCTKTELLTSMIEHCFKEMENK